MKVGIPWRVSITVAKRAVTSTAWRPPRLLLIGAALALGAWAPVTAAAATSTTGSATISIPVVVAIKSVTLSTNSLTYGTCSGGTSTSSALGFPNGICSTSQIHITTGTAPSNVGITGADAVPADSGQHWLLCWPTVSPPAATASCSGTTDASTGFIRPSSDQFVECTLAVTEANGCDSSGPFIGATEGVFAYTPTCDLAFNNSGTPINCTTVPAQTTSNEYVFIVGPTSSTDTSSSFTTTVTWSVS